MKNSESEVVYRNDEENKGKKCCQIKNKESMEQKKEYRDTEQNSLRGELIKRSIF